MRMDASSDAFVSDGGVPDLPFIPRGSGGRRYRRARLLRRLRAYVHPLVRGTHETTTPFVIISGVRTGSHLARSLLESHPDVACLDELLQIRTIDPIRLVRNSLRARHEPVVGFLTKPNHVSIVQRVGLDGWIDWMTEQGFRSIQIVRRDLLKQALSIFVAREHRIWAHTADHARPVESMEVEPERIMAYVDFLRFWKPVEAEFARRLHAMRVYYEDDLLDAGRHQSTADRMFEHLGLASSPVTTELRKILPNDPRMFVRNWEEIEARFASAQFEDN